MIYDKIIEIGLLFLLVYTPFAFGGVTPYGLVTIQTVTGGLLLIWLIRLWSQRYTFQFNALPCAIPVLLFVGLIVLQQIPLPVAVLSTLSPQAYQLYSEAARLTGASLPHFVPLSICVQATEGGLLMFLVYPALFFLMINIIRTPAQIYRFLYIIITVGLLEALSAIVYIFSKTHLLPFYADIVKVGGSFVNKNHFAGYIEMVILLALGLLFSGRNSAQSDFTRHQTRGDVLEYRIKRGVVLFVILVMVLAHVLSGSRGGLISLAGGGLCFVLLTARRHVLRKWVRLGLILLPVLMLSLVLVAPAEIFSKLERFTGEQIDTSFQIRWEIWRTQGHIFQDFPLLGTGWGTLAHIARRYQTFRWALRLAHSESDVVQLFAEMGIIGVGIFLWFGLAYFQQILRKSKRRHSRWAIALVSGGLSALVSLLIHGLVDFNLHIPSNTLLFTVIAALVYVTVFIHRQRQPSVSMNSMKRRTFTCVPILYYGVIAVLAGIVGLYLWSSINVFRAFRHSQDFQKTPLLPQAGNNVDTIIAAITTDRNHPDYPYMLAKALYEARELDEAEEWLRKAIGLDPANPDYYATMAQIYFRRGACGADQQNPKDACPITRYWLAAWENNSKDVFLRTQAARWLYVYDREAGEQFIRNILAEDANILITKGNKKTLTFAEFLYEIHWDYGSDLETARVLHLPPVSCGDTSPLRRSSDGGEIVLGHDNGTPEWKTRLWQPAHRVKKTFCLPKDSDAYQTAALEIFMNRRLAVPVDITIGVNEHRFTVDARNISNQAQWQSVPISLEWLKGQSIVNVYIRASAPAPGGFLEIWGDPTTPGVYSLRDFRQKRDLSLENGGQTGEYLIRLVLQK